MSAAAQSGPWGLSGPGLIALVLLAGCSGGPPRPTAEYVGVEVCRECHPTAWRVWLGSRHARSSVTLQTGIARGIAEREEERAECLAEAPSCLECHGVGVAKGQRLASLGEVRAEEGVTCEACHGPASLHVAAARAQRPRPGLVASLLHPERACADCHQRRASHQHELLPQFEETAARAAIRHALEDPPAVDWLRPAARPRQGAAL